MIAAAWGDRRFAVADSDRAIAGRWETAGYPLELVTRTVGRMADRNRSRKMPAPERLSYFDAEVQLQCDGYLADAAARAASEPPPWPAAQPEPEEGEELWEALLAGLRGALEPEEYATWWSPAKFQGLSGDAVRVWLPNAHMAHVISRNEQVNSVAALLGLEIALVGLPTEEAA